MDDIVSDVYNIRRQKIQDSFAAADLIHIQLALCVCLFLFLVKYFFMMLLIFRPVPGGSFTQW